MKPFFSIVIPLFNKERFIEKTIQSVLNQTYQDFEIIIINDGSTDASLENVERIKDQRISIFTTKNQGVSHARNHGLSKTTGLYISFLDADDYWHEGFLECIKDLIEKYPNESVFASALKIETDNLIYKASYKGIETNNLVSVVDYFEASQDHSILHCSSSIFKKSALEYIGGFDENLNTSEDTDFWIRVGLKYQVVFTNNTLALHRVVGNGLTKSNRASFKALDFSKYNSLVIANPFAQRFLNKNKFAAAIRFKRIGDYKSFTAINNQLDKNLISTKQKILLVLPRSILISLINVYNKCSSKKNYF